MPPGSNYYSEQLRQKANLLQGGMPPQGGPPHPAQQSQMNGPGQPAQGGPGFNPGPQGGMINNGPNFNNSNAPQPGQVIPGQGGMPNGPMGRSGTPNSNQGGQGMVGQGGNGTPGQQGYPPSASPGANQNFSQNGPGKSDNNRSIILDNSSGLSRIQTVGGGGDWLV